MRQYCVALAGLLLLCCSLSRDAGSAEELPVQGQVLATYDIALAGFSLGEFQLKARFKGPSYEMQGEGRFSLFLGRVHKSSGNVTSTGRLRRLGPESASFILSYEGGDKEEEASHQLRWRRRQRRLHCSAKEAGASAACR